LDFICALSIRAALWAASKVGGACIVVSKGGTWPAQTLKETPFVEILVECMIPVAFYSAVLLFVFSDLNEA
jgi:hypothetical protein